MGGFLEEASLESWGGLGVPGWPEQGWLCNGRYVRAVGCLGLKDRMGSHRRRLRGPVVELGGLG